MIRNFLDLPLTPETIHDGQGLCPHACVLEGAEFQTPIRFLNYTVLPPQASFGAHQHGDDNEIYIVLEGSGVYTTDGDAQRVKTGDILVNPPFATHAIQNTGDSDMRLLVLEVYNR
jgi:mannose-6-phosphate isomerase-like protein (cupin superfamily)